MISASAGIRGHQLGIGPISAAQYGTIGNGEGVECFYNYHLTPAVRLTPDFQVVVPALRDFGTALIRACARS